MAFHRDHLARFLTNPGVSNREGWALMNRAEEAITQYSNKDEGLFSASQLDEVMGNSEFVSTFNCMWEGGELY